jgi:hypothetical protein
LFTPDKLVGGGVTAPVQEMLGYFLLAAGLSAGALLSGK